VSHTTLKPNNYSTAPTRATLFVIRKATQHIMHVPHTAAKTVSKKVRVLQTTHNKSLWTRVYPGNQLHWYQQPDSKQTTENKICKKTQKVTKNTDARIKNMQNA